MKWFYNLKTATKLIASFLIVSLMLAGVGLFSLMNLSTLNSAIEDMYHERLQPVKNMTEARYEYQRMRTLIRDIGQQETTAGKDALTQDTSDIRVGIESVVDVYSQRDLTGDQRQALNAFNTAWENYNQVYDRAIELSYADDEAAFYALLYGDLQRFGNELDASLGAIVNLNVEVADRANDEALQTYQSSLVITIVVIIIAFVVSIGLGVFISASISRPLNKVVQLVGQVADGDLRNTTDIHTKDEIGLLADSVNQMVLRLRTTVTGILGSSESVSAAAQQISASTEEIANGSSSQADSAQTMNELFQELSAAITAVAQGAEEASELSNETTTIAQAGGEVVRDSVEGMSRVSEQMARLEDDSNKIGEIIEVIDDIADQTNLLALNAAIEAARAGDQGRGFAVVADEVRKLAERSSEATKQITSIIKGMQDNTQHSVRSVADGVESSQRTGEAFDKIIDMVNESARKIAEIAAASEQQSAQSSEVLVSIETISSVTEESAASSEETASTAQSLAQLSEELNGMVAVFKVN